MIHPSGRGQWLSSEAEEMLSRSLLLPSPRALSMGARSSPFLIPAIAGGTSMRMVMRDKGKNRKPLQKGRNLSIEAIQAVQALKRAKVLGGEGGEPVKRIMDAKVRRLVKFDMMGVLGELQRQGEALLALRVFEEVRDEHWYKPQMTVYADMLRVLAINNDLENFKLVTSDMKNESLQGNTEGFNALVQTLLEFGFCETAMECFGLMKSWEIEPDESTFRTLVLGLEARGEVDASEFVKREAKKCFGRPLDFPEEHENASLIQS